MEGKTKTKNLKEEPTMSNLIETKKVNDYSYDETEDGESNKDEE